MSLQIVEKIKKISEQYGAEVPFLRPKILSRDSSKAQEVVIHCIEFLKKKKFNFNYVCCIYPTTPLIQINDLKKKDYQKLRKVEICLFCM